MQLVLIIDSFQELIHSGFYLCILFEFFSIEHASNLIQKQHFNALQNRISLEAIHLILLSTLTVGIKKGGKNKADK